jgi:hypothetical protein
MRKAAPHTAMIERNDNRVALPAVQTACIVLRDRPDGSEDPSVRPFALPSLAQCCSMLGQHRHAGWQSLGVIKAWAVKTKWRVASD